MGIEVNITKARGWGQESWETFLFEAHKDSLQCKPPTPQNVESDGGHGKRAEGNASKNAKLSATKD